MKILQNKKVLILIGFISIAGLVCLFLYLRKQRLVDVDESADSLITDDDTIEVDDSQAELLLENPVQDDLYDRKEVGTIGVNLPKSWDNDLQDYSEESHEYVHVRSSSLNDSFVFDITHEYVTDEELINYQSENIDSQALYSLIDDYVEMDFEVIAVINGQTLLVSKLGGIEYKASVVAGKELTLDYPNYVYQKYERDDGTLGISFAITAFDERMDEPKDYQSTIISYTFHSQKEIENWSSYKKVLAEIIGSM